MGILVMGTHDLGTSGPAASGLAEPLFTSVQQRVLALLFAQPSRSFQHAELIKLADAAACDAPDCQSPGGMPAGPGEDAGLTGILGITLLLLSVH
jgi:hypothetical protein